jgi:hypothetical protein
MQKDERDLLEVRRFELFEETVGNWLRSIIRRLEKERMAIRSGPFVLDSRQKIRNRVCAVKSCDSY